MKFIEGDKVVIIAGKDKGHVGIIQKVNKKDNTVVVEKAGMKTYTTKPNQDQPEGALERKEGPINASNVMFYADAGKKGEDAIVSKISISRKADPKSGRNKVVRTLKKTGMEL